MIKAVILDMDGVIIDSEMGYLEDILEYAHTLNSEITLDQLYPMVGGSRKDAWSVLAEAAGGNLTWQEVQEGYKKRGDIFSKIDYQAIFRQETLQLLEEIKRRGYRLALASSTQMDVILHVLKVNGIESYFDEVVSGEQFKRSKPDPEIYHYTSRKLGVSEEECLVIEDSTFGVQAAHAAGMTVIALEDPRFGFDHSLAAYRIRSLKEAAAYL